MININRVWLTDDDEEEHLLFRELIGEHNPSIEVDFCLNGLQLMFKLKNSLLLPEVIFLDINMPFKTGHEVLHDIKSDRRVSHIPVIMYSTSTNAADILKAYSIGAQLYFKKVVNFPELKEKIPLAFGKISERTRVSFDKFVY